MEYIVAQGSTAVPVEVIGGKGANLSRLSAAGFTVPRWAAVTTEAYREFVKVTGIQSEVDALLEHLDIRNFSGLEATTARIRELIVTADMPEEIEASVRKAYSELGRNNRVAVRSSGTAEDAADASFAGMHDTLLDVRGADRVVLAVQSCWSSMWTARATAYRAVKGYAHATALISVVIQEMVQSEISGVMFTTNPNNVDGHEILVSSTWGLGEAVVSGLVDADEYALDGRDLTVKRRTLGRKEKQVIYDRAAGSGTVVVEVPAEKQRLFTLSDEQLDELVRCGLRVVDHYDGYPQDIEWAYRDGAFHLLQSRPVTGLAS